MDEQKRRFAVITKIPNDLEGNYASSEMYVCPEKKDCVVGDELLAEGEIRTEDDRRWPVVIRIKEDE